MEIASASRRGESVSLEVESQGLDELIAKIETLESRGDLTSDERLQLVIQKEVADRLSRSSNNLSYALRYFLLNLRFSRFIGYDTATVAASVKRLSEYFVRNSSRLRRETPIDAWPKSNSTNFVVKFEISESSYLKLCETDFNKLAMLMGNAGGVIASELDHEAFVSRFIPALIYYTIARSKSLECSPDQVLEQIGVEPEFWAIGLS